MQMTPAADDAFGADGGFNPFQDFLAAGGFDAEVPLPPTPAPAPTAVRPPIAAAPAVPLQLRLYQPRQGLHPQLPRQTTSSVALPLVPPLPRLHKPPHPQHLMTCLGGLHLEPHPLSHPSQHPLLLQLPQHLPGMHGACLLKRHPPPKGWHPPSHPQQASTIHGDPLLLGLLQPASLQDPFPPLQWVGSGSVRPPCRHSHRPTHPCLHRNLRTLLSRSHRLLRNQSPLPQDVQCVPRALQAPLPRSHPCKLLGHPFRLLGHPHRVLGHPLPMEQPPLPCFPLRCHPPKQQVQTHGLQPLAWPPLQQ